MKSNTPPSNKDSLYIKKLTDAELMLLGLVAEMPRHGYELEQVIKQRGMREWTSIGFSSIYFVLGKLEKSNLVRAEKPEGTKARKVFSATGLGYQVLAAQSEGALRHVKAVHSSVLLGMAHWPVMDKAVAVAALRARGETLGAEMMRLEEIQFGQVPLPEFVEAMFDYSLSLLRAEAEWVKRTADYMECKPE